MVPLPRKQPTCGHLWIGASSRNLNKASEGENCITRVARPSAAGKATQAPREYRADICMYFQLGAQCHDLQPRDDRLVQGVGGSGRRRQLVFRESPAFLRARNHVLARRRRVARCEYKRATAREPTRFQWLRPTAREPPEFRAKVR
jgi:hypothetical protein